MNCYTPAKLISIVNEHPQVNAMAMERSDFQDWDTLENKMIKTADEILRNHVFAVMTTSPNTHNVNPRVRRHSCSATRACEETVPRHTVDWKPHFKLRVLPPLGLPNIKWNELYVKWGRFVPEDKKSGLIYYKKKPPDLVKQKIAAQNAAAS